MATDRERTPADDADETPAERLESTNALLAAWAASSIEESGPLIERLEALGYDLRGKSREEIEAALKAPPTRPARG
ncbi:hypothetical protein [Methylobacterium dankookense]|uniref:Uncharacterized protein n=1 Tax=Methylobacterium dankookense TaxID=560405 RepID=A0A564G408_9HYPH|nr:hypothetical protein [Methylobacterium dankookense]GJD59598.1 hypothetical protein IFDJLNFL_5527 [Methylobacterium dankookense]VUF14710.1 hypothetical protein MTDSW087_04435 [Methylobacterium dankookense]